MEKLTYNTKQIGARIQRVRRARCLTQDKLSAMVDIGEKFLSQIECGKAGLSLQTLLALCNVLDVSPNYLLGYTGTENSALQDIACRLTDEQLLDAERILQIFADNCRQ